jgi:hypothetical protein
MAKRSPIRMGLGNDAVVVVVVEVVVVVVSLLSLTVSTPVLLKMESRNVNALPDIQSMAPII